MTALPAITAATASQVDALVELLFAQHAEHEIPTKRPHLRERLLGLLAAPALGFVLVAQHEQRPVGFAYVTFALPIEHAGEVAWLEELYVEPDQRNRGIGRALVREVIERAEQRGCVSVELEVTRSHARAARLYTREGFRDLERAHLARPLRRWDW